VAAGLKVGNGLNGNCSERNSFANMSCDIKDDTEFCVKLLEKNNSGVSYYSQPSLSQATGATKKRPL
jgi:hypothetical protein